MSVNNPVDLIQAKHTASAVHILHIDRIAKATGSKKITASILTHPYSSYTDDDNEQDDNNPKKMFVDRVIPIIKRRTETAKHDPNFPNLLPDEDQRESLLHQAAILAIQSLTEHVEGFKHAKYVDDPRLKFPKKRPLPEKYRTHSSTILSTLVDSEKVTPTRIISLIRDTYTTKLHIKEKDLIKHPIPCINDASINTLIRETIVHPKTAPADQDLLSTFQLGPGLNDILRKLVAKVIKAHCPRGLESQYGLAPLFKAIGEDHLALGKPSDFEAALISIETVAQSVLIDCIELHCGFDDLEAYAASDPSPEDLLALARKVVIRHAKRIVPEQPERFPDDRKYSDPDVSDREGTAEEDEVFTTHRLMLRDMMYVASLKRAICDADFGRVEDLLGVVSMYLLGAGMDNTAMEILHFLYDLKYVWSETFAANLALYSKFFYESYGWSDEWHAPKTMDEAIALVDKFDTKLAMKDITERMEREGDCCVM